MQIFRIKQNFPAFASFDNWKKSIDLDTQNAVVTTVSKKSLSNFWKLLLKIGKPRKIDKFSKKLFRQIVRLNMHNETLTSLP